MDVNNYGCWYENILEESYKKDDKIFSPYKLNIYTGIFGNRKGEALFEVYYENNKDRDIKFEEIVYGNMIFRTNRNGVFLPVESEIMGKNLAKRSFQRLVDRLRLKKEYPIIANIANNINNVELKDENILNIIFFEVTGDGLPKDVALKINQSWDL